MRTQNLLNGYSNPIQNRKNIFPIFFKENPELEKKYLQVKKELKLLSITEKEISYAKGSEIFKAISDQINSTKINKKRNLNYQILLRYAAIALVFFAVGALLFLFSIGEQN